MSENPLCSRKSVTNFKESQEEDEIKFVDLFEVKGNSKFKGKVAKFEEEAKKAAAIFKTSEKKVVDLFGRNQPKIEASNEVKTHEEKKTDIKPNIPGAKQFVFNPSVSVKFNF